MSQPFRILSVVTLMAFAIPGGRAAEAMDGAAVVRELIKLNDRRVESALERPLAARGSGLEHRLNGAQLWSLAASFTHEASRFRHDARLVPAMNLLVAALRERQWPDGLFDAGNLDSPPDTAFILETLCQAQALLVRDASPATAPVRETLRTVILSAAEGVRTGGVHTPNHRWHVCAALAHVNQLYPDKKYLDRIDDWLGEGIDIDRDGQFAERSPHYTSEVVNPALLTLAVLLDRPELLEPVRRSLEQTLFLLEPNGEVETVASRRQDQRTGAREFIWKYYVPYRYLAIRDGNGRFAAVARWIEREFLADAATTFSPNAPLPLMLELSEILRDLPPGQPLPGDYTHVFSRMAMARIRHGATTATIYGGSDIHAGLGSGSGLATNPAFFKFRKGAAVLESIRMTPAFFGTGFFYSDGLAVENGVYRLHQTLNVPYHLPLPAAARKADGDYALSADGRFFSKLDFEHRPKQFRTLTSTVAVTEKAGEFELEFVVDGVPNVPVTIELAFRTDGTLSGVKPLTEVGPAAGATGRGRATGGAPDERADSFVLASGLGRFTAGADTIEFGPGTLARAPGRMEGEDYTWVNGSLRAEGHRVYLTGITPFHHTLTIR